jgi:hypothetical protein
VRNHFLARACCDGQKKKERLQVGLNLRKNSLPCQDNNPLEFLEVPPSQDKLVTRTTGCTKTTVFVSDNTVLFDRCVYNQQEDGFVGGRVDILV